MKQKVEPDSVHNDWHLNIHRRSTYAPVKLNAT